jgi:O-methyltransferase
VRVLAFVRREFSGLIGKRTLAKTPDSEQSAKLQKRLRNRNRQLALTREQLATTKREIRRLLELNQERSAGAHRNFVKLEGRPSGSALYLDLMKRCLTDLIYSDKEETEKAAFQWSKAKGQRWPRRAHTMIGPQRLDNLQFCVEDVLKRNVPGDLIETGVWRGGATILMRAVLKAYEVEDRHVWVSDSFEGLPPPNAEKYPHDARDVHHTKEALAIPLEEVKDNFERYGLLDDQVRFLKGWFRDTLPVAPIERLAVIRLDGDMYESTMDGLTTLYPKLSLGGYLIVDDYGAVPACRQAVHDYREANGIDDEIRSVDWTAVYWRRAS